MFPGGRILIYSILTADTITHNTVGFGALVESIPGMIISQPLKRSYIVATVIEGVLMRLWHGGPGAGLTEGLDHTSHDCISFSALNISNSNSRETNGVIDREATNVRISVSISDTPGAEKLRRVFPSDSNIPFEIFERQLKAVSHVFGKDPRHAMKAYGDNFIESIAELEHKYGFIMLMFSVSGAFRASAHDGFTTLDNQQCIDHRILKDTRYVPHSPTCNSAVATCYVGITTRGRLQCMRNEIDVYGRTGGRALGDVSYSYGLYSNSPSMVIDMASFSLGIDQDFPEWGIGIRVVSDLIMIRSCIFMEASVKLWIATQTSVGYVLDVIPAIGVNQSGLMCSSTHLLTFARNKPHAFETVENYARCIDVFESQVRTGSQADDFGEMQDTRDIIACNCHVRPLHIPLKASISRPRVVSGSINVVLMDHDRTTPLVIPFKNPNYDIASFACDITTTAQSAWIPPEKPGYTLLLSPRLVIGFQLRNVSTRVSYINFPTYPLTRGSLRFPLGEDTLTTPPPHKAPPFLLMADPHILKTWSQHPTQADSYVAVFETPINQLALATQGHGDHVIPPFLASAFIAQIFTVLELVRQFLPNSSSGSHAILRNIEFTQSLAYDERVSRTVVTKLTAHDGGGTFSIISRVNGSAEESAHMHGEYKVEPTLKASTKFRRTLPAINRRISAVTQLKPRKAPQRFSTRTIYEVIFPRVINYAKEYRIIRSLVLDSSRMEGFASVQYPASQDHSKFVVRPVFTETLFQVAGFMTNILGGPDGAAYILSGVGSIRVIWDQVGDGASYNVFCNMWRLPDQDVLLADVYATTLSEPPALIARMKDIHFRSVHPDSSKNPSLATTGTPRRASYTPPAPAFSRLSSTVQTSPSFIPLPSSTQSRTEVEAFGRGPLFPDFSPCSNQSSRYGNTSESSSRIPHSSSSRTMIEPQSKISSPRTLMPEEHLAEPTLPLVNGEGDLGNSRDVAGDIDIVVDSSTPGKAIATLSRCLSSDDPTARGTQSYPSCHLPNEPSLRSPEASTQGAEAYRHFEDPLSMVTPDSATRLTRVLKLGTIPLPLQNSDSDNLPLFLIHDGSGLVNYYHGIISLGRRVWGFNNPKFITSEPWSGIIEMASVYVDHISRISTGPVIVGGWSFGGLVAYEVSKQLAMRGVKTQGILVIDSPGPIDHIPLSNDIIDFVVNLNARRPNFDLARLIKNQFSMNAHFLGRYDPRATSGACPPLVFLRSSEGFNPPGVSDVPLWLSDRSNPKSSTAGWEEIASGPIEVLDIPGHHFVPFHPTNIKSVGERMFEGCTFLENV